MKRTLARFLRQTDGAAAIEFAVVGTIFIFLSLASIEFARNFHVQHRMAQMADKLARMIYLDQAITQTALTQAMISLGGSDMTLTVQSGTKNGVSVRTLTLTSPRNYISPFLSGLTGDIRILRPVPLTGAYF